jgi:hypothetical protein
LLERAKGDDKIDDEIRVTTMIVVDKQWMSRPFSIANQAAASRPRAVPEIRRMIARSAPEEIALVLR